MAYKYNGGIGAVICDGCRVMIDMEISDYDYRIIYKNKDGDFCWRCKLNLKEIKNKQRKNG